LTPTVTIKKFKLTAKTLQENFVLLGGDSARAAG